MPESHLEYFTVKQASLILGFSTNSVYKFLKVGRLKGTRGSKIQGRFRISRKSIEDFLGTPLTDDFILTKIYPSPIPTKTPKKNPTNINTTYTQPEPPKTPTKAPEHPIPLKVTRALIIIALIAIIADLIFNPDFSLLQQFIRLSLLSIIVLITYQYGDTKLHHPTESED